VHRVLPVTRGARLACFFWVQSLVADDAERHILHQLDQHLTALRSRLGESEETVGLVATYHNLLRRWSQTG
jgi:PKHD-type hydroxylase